MVGVFIDYVKLLWLFFLFYLIGDRFFCFFKVKWRSEAIYVSWRVEWFECGFELRWYCYICGLGVKFGLDVF